MNVLTAPGKRLFLSGDEAVARAALELGVQVVTGYPGCPGGSYRRGMGRATQPGDDEDVRGECDGGLSALYCS